MNTITVTNYGRTLLLVLIIVLSTGCANNPPSINREYGHWDEVKAKTFLGGEVKFKAKTNSSLTKLKKWMLHLNWPHDWFGG